MAFPERLLSEDEELIYDLRPHWLTLVVPVLITLVVVVAVGAASQITAPLERLGFGTPTVLPA